MEVGCSEIVITPNLPINLGGYSARRQQGRGVASQLFARGFVFAHQAVKAGLITADLLMLNRSQANQVRAAASRLTGIAEENIIVTCSHTHSGPSTFTLPGMDTPPDPDYINWLLKALAGTLLLAAENKEPCRLGHRATAVTGISASRRQRELPVDRELIVVGFQNQAGALKALLFNFSCHPTVLDASNLLVSPDYPGAAVSAFRKIYPATVAAFINGACGDISTRFLRRAQTEEEVERLGTVLGGYVTALASDLQFDAAGLTVDSLTLPVALKPLPSLEAIEREYKLWQKRLEELQSRGADPAQLRLAQTGLEGAMMQKQRAAVIGELEREAEINLWRMGSLGLASIPGELFSALGRQIKDRSPCENTIIAGYSNGYIGYIPDMPAYEQGGYETLASPVERGFGEQLAESAARRLRGLK